ncbi:hypothetical protein SDC9_125282 [bioreactor metagenome]|uniref:Uncharacterized protein n=1 Tax=bioreactor metagenome TaxID=1076179 RepID=A0A645CMV6_9ZZZZ
MVYVLFVFRLFAAEFGTYPSLLAAANTRERIASVTQASRLSARDTVARETFASLAISLMVAAFIVFTLFMSNFTK